MNIETYIKCRFPFFSTSEEDFYGNLYYQTMHEFYGDTSLIPET